MVKALSIWSAVVVAAALATAPPVQADMPLIYKDGGQSLFRISAPDFWQVRSGGRRQLALPGTDDSRDVARVIGLEPAADKGVWVGFISPRGVSTFAQARDYLREIGPFLVKDAKVGDLTRRHIGGLPAATLKGAGRRNGRLVEFTAIVIDLPRGRMAISVVVFEHGVSPEIANDVNAIFGSFRAVN